MKGLNAQQPKRTIGIDKYDEPSARECFEMMERYIKRCLTLLAPYPHFGDLRQDGANILKIAEQRRDVLYPAKPRVRHEAKKKPLSEQAMKEPTWACGDDNHAHAEAAEALECQMVRELELDK